MASMGGRASSGSPDISSDAEPFSSSTDVPAGQLHHVNTSVPSGIGGFRSARAQSMKNSSSFPSHLHSHALGISSSSTSSQLQHSFSDSSVTEDVVKGIQKGLQTLIVTDQSQKNVKSSPADTEIGDEDIEKYRCKFPLDIKYDFFDAILIYQEQNKKQATQFLELVRCEVRLGETEKPKVELYDEIITEAGPEIKNLDKCLELCNYILLYITKEFCKDKWTEFHGQTALMNAIDDPSMKWSVVPIFTEHKRNTTYKVPPSIRSLKGINYISSDKFYPDWLRKLLEDKWHVRKEKEAELRHKRILWIATEKVNERVKAAQNESERKSHTEALKQREEKEESEIKRQESQLREKLYQMQNLTYPEPKDYNQYVNLYDKQYENYYVRSLFQPVPFPRLNSADGLLNVSVQKPAPERKAESSGGSTSFINPWLPVEHAVSIDPVQQLPGSLKSASPWQPRSYSTQGQQSGDSQVFGSLPSFQSAVVHHQPASGQFGPAGLGSFSKANLPGPAVLCNQLSVSANLAMEKSSSLHSSDSQMGQQASSCEFASSPITPGVLAQSQTQASSVQQLTRLSIGDASPRNDDLPKEEHHSIPTTGDHPSRSDLTTDATSLQSLAGTKDTENHTKLLSTTHSTVKGPSDDEGSEKKFASGWISEPSLTAFESGYQSQKCIAVPAGPSLADIDGSLFGSSAHQGTHLGNFLPQQQNSHLSYGGLSYDPTFISGGYPFLHQLPYPVPPGQQESAMYVQHHHHYYGTPPSSTFNIQRAENVIIGDRVDFNVNKTKAAGHRIEPRHPVGGQERSDFGDEMPGTEGFPAMSPVENTMQEPNLQHSPGPRVAPVISNQSEMLTPDNSRGQSATNHGYNPFSLHYGWADRPSDAVEQNNSASRPNYAYDQSSLSDVLTMAQEQSYTSAHETQVKRLYDDDDHDNDKGGSI